MLDAHQQGQTEAVATIKIGPSLVFERLWRALELPEILGALLDQRRFEFAVERAVFLTILHRLFAPGSDRAAEVWRAGQPLRDARSWSCIPFTVGSTRAKAS